MIDLPFFYESFFVVRQLSKTTDTPFSVDIASFRNRMRAGSREKFSLIVRPQA